MHTHSTILAFAGASLVSLASANIIPPRVTPGPGVVAIRGAGEAVYPRTPTGSLYTECSKAAESLGDGYPFLPEVVQTFFVTATQFRPTTTRSDTSDYGVQPTDISSVCHLSMSALESITSAPGPVATALASYKSILKSWQSSVAPAASSLAAKCIEVTPDDAGYMLYYVAQDERECAAAVSLMLGFTDKYALAPATTTSTTASAPKGTGAGATGGQQQQGQSGAPTSTSTSTGAAAGARETGYIAVAAVAAVGAVVGAVGL
ncbi:hypothetical protein QBC43DRAFT_305258 [Cladorrhinum sp. PSN259]|nr:hypothetical protein QBC43DRAFT_305258 [Cladorrhinum sp. PSN259]